MNLSRSPQEPLTVAPPVQVINHKFPPPPFRLGSGLIWSARTCPRYGTGRHVCQFHSGDVLPHSKFSRCSFEAFLDLRGVIAILSRSGFCAGHESLEFMKRQYQPSKVRRKRQHGFLARSKTTAGPRHARPPPPRGPQTPHAGLIRERRAAETPASGPVVAARAKPRFHARAAGRPTAGARLSDCELEPAARGGAAPAGRGHEQKNRRSGDAQPRATVAPRKFPAAPIRALAAGGTGVGRP